MVTSTTSEGPGPEHVVDSPTGWVADHIKSYVASDGGGRPRVASGRADAALVGAGPQVGHLASFRADLWP